VVYWDAGYLFLDYADKRTLLSPPNCYDQNVRDVNQTAMKDDVTSDVTTSSQVFMC